MEFDKQNTLHNSPPSESAITPSREYYAIGQDSKNMAIIIWVGALFVGFIAPLVLMLIKTDDRFVQSHSKECLNMFITSFIIGVVCSFTAFLIIPLFILAILGIAYLVFCIMGAVKAANGERFKIPMPMLRLIK